MQDAILVTGGAGFIGSSFVHHWLEREPGEVINVDKLTYAGSLENLEALRAEPRHHFVRGCITDHTLLGFLFQTHQPRAVVHFAAETHVDRSIRAPEEFIRTNVLGSFQILSAARDYWQGLEASARERFRFLHISSDEVYGSLGTDAAPFCETSPYSPNSPYSASKAAADHLVRAYGHTYGLPALITNSSNNFGPRQFPEKLIPLTITQALQGKPLPVYGDGLQVRDWLYVEDHCEALRAVLIAGAPGATYNIGARCERTNLAVVTAVCEVMEELRPRGGYRSLIAHVDDRPGHDRRYAIDAGKIEGELGWRAKESFESGIRKTVRWYLENPRWIENVLRK
jgi:dTDP-glucose 4,6-dehydratase